MVIPSPIYIGKGITTDTIVAVNDRSLSNRRISRITCKYTLKPEYAIYELVGVNKTISGDIIYSLISTLDDHILKLKERDFNDRFETDHG